MDRCLALGVPICPRKKSSQLERCNLSCLLGLRWGFRVAWRLLSRCMHMPCALCVCILCMYIWERKWVSVFVFCVFIYYRCMLYLLMKKKFSLVSFVRFLVFPDSCYCFLLCYNRFFSTEWYWVWWWWKYAWLALSLFHSWNNNVFPFIFFWMSFSDYRGL